MVEERIFTVFGEPKAKARPRMTRSGFPFTPKQTVFYENYVKTCYLEAYVGRPMMEGEIHAHINAVFGIPKSVSKKKRQEMIDGKINPTKKPDLDNIAKSILDSLNGIAYKDDSHVVRLSVAKQYGENPKVEVHLISFLEE